MPASGADGTTVTPDNIHITEAILKQFANNIEKEFQNPNTFVGPFSFIDLNAVEDKNCPAPKYFTNEMLTKPLSSDYKEIMHGLTT